MLIGPALVYLLKSAESRQVWPYASASRVSCPYLAVNKNNSWKTKITVLLPFMLIYLQCYAIVILISTWHNFVQSFTPVVQLLKVASNKTIPG